MKKVSLIILDWFGINEATPEENSITQAENRPNFSKLFAFPWYTRLKASWRDVWIVDGFMWGSEVWHLTIWAGKIVKQNILEINDLLDNGEFEKLPEFTEMIDYLRKSWKSLHIAGLLGTPWVHSYQPHLYWLLKIIPSEINVYLHLFTDWRDSPRTESVNYLQELIDFISDKKNVKISSISGRYFAMDRDNNWERIQKSYDAILGKIEKSDKDPVAYLKQSYSDKVFDEFIEPIYFVSGKAFESGDVFLHYNYRSDRATQLTKIIEKDFWSENIYTMTKYYNEFAWKYFIKKQKVENTLWEIISEKWLSQLHIAETEKFAHVTKFFNWWAQIVYPWEKDILVASHKVATYDMDPEMSADEIFAEYEKNAKDFDFTVVNYANGDMVGHTWCLVCTSTSIEKLDEIIWKTIDYCAENNIDLFITADHWNCEVMWTPQDPCTSHTTNEVPFWYIKDGEVVKTKPNWWLSNVAPTILEIMWITKASDMKESLLLD